MKIRLGMSYKVGDIVLVKFPFTNLKKFKKRPVLVVKSQSNLNDIVCFQITSNSKQSNLLKIQKSEIVEKSIAQVNTKLLTRLKSAFCEELF